MLGYAINATPRATACGTMAARTLAESPRFDEQKRSHWDRWRM